MRTDDGVGENARAVVVARLRARRDELVRAIFARVRGDAFGSAGTPHRPNEDRACLA
jgi:hypothetical protein